MHAGPFVRQNNLAFIAAECIATAIPVHMQSPRARRFTLHLSFRRQDGAALGRHQPQGQLREGSAVGLPGPQHQGPRR